MFFVENILNVFLITSFGKVVTGNWLVDGNPLIVLFDIGSASWNTDTYKNELFEKSGIGIPHHDTESNDAVVFGFMAAQFIAEVLDS